MDYKTLKIDDIPQWWFKRAWTAFEKYDVDNDGVISVEDLMTIADRLVAIGNLKGEAADRVYAFYRENAISDDELSFLAPSIYDSVRRVWIMVTQHRDRTISYYNVFHGMKFDAVDFNGDGVISLDEFHVYWQAMGLDMRFVDLQFAYMDVDGDGKISKKEFVKANVDYYNDLDGEHILNRMYGPLINF